MSLYFFIDVLSGIIVSSLYFEMHMELFGPGSLLNSDQLYNFITAHAFIMVCIIHVLPLVPFTETIKNILEIHNYFFIVFYMVVVACWLGPLFDSLLISNGLLTEPEVTVSVNTTPPYVEKEVIVPDLPTQEQVFFLLFCTVVVFFLLDSI
jgi:heme/copper-type cytochrome/quinol oxidase subunit 1